MESLIEFERSSFEDSRGKFSELYNSEAFSLLNHKNFVQDNLSYSKSKNTIRGLHAQIPPMAQGKLVSCIRGEILDFAVDIRKKSPNYLQWKVFELSEKNNKCLYIPEGFLHGFQTMQDDTLVFYKCTNHYHKEAELNILFSDPEIGIEWNAFDFPPIISEKDKSGINLSVSNNPF